MRCLASRRRLKTSNECLSSPACGRYSGVQIFPRHALEAEDVVGAESEARGLEAGLEVSRGDAHGGVEAPPGGGRVALPGFQGAPAGFPPCVPPRSPPPRRP